MLLQQFSSDRSNPENPCFHIKQGFGDPWRDLGIERIVWNVSPSDPIASILKKGYCLVIEESDCYEHISAWWKRIHLI